MPPHLRAAMKKPRQEKHPPGLLFFIQAKRCARG